MWFVAGQNHVENWYHAGLHVLPIPTSHDPWMAFKRWCWWRSRWGLHLVTSVFAKCVGQHPDFGMPTAKNRRYGQPMVRVTPGVTSKLDLQMSWFQGYAPKMATVGDALRSLFGLRRYVSLDNLLGSPVRIWGRKPFVLLGHTICFLFGVVWKKWLVFPFFWTWLSEETKFSNCWVSMKCLMKASVCLWCCWKIRRSSNRVEWAFWVFPTLYWNQSESGRLISDQFPSTSMLKPW